MFYVYVIKCNNNDLYIGRTDDLRKRFAEHSTGKVKSTKNKQPILIYYEAYKDKRDATKREYNLKTGQQREMLKDRVKFSMA